MGASHNVQGETDRVLKKVHEDVNTSDRVCKKNYYDCKVPGVEVELHSMEINAYSSVLETFIAQSDFLSWEKEGLISQLRKELNVTDTEHKELLARINLDGTVKLMRERRRNCSIAQDITLGFPPSNRSRVRGRIVNPPYASVPNIQKHVSFNQYFSAAPTPLPGKRGHNTKMLVKSRSPSVVNHGTFQFYSGKGSQTPDNYTEEKELRITIPETAKLLDEVKRVILGANEPDACLLMKARLVLEEQQMCLLNAIDRLSAHASDDDMQQQYTSTFPPYSDPVEHCKGMTFLDTSEWAS